MQQLSVMCKNYYNFLRGGGWCWRVHLYMCQKTLCSSGRDLSLFHDKHSTFHEDWYFRSYLFIIYLTFIYVSQISSQFLPCIKTIFFAGGRGNQEHVSKNTWLLRLSEEVYLYFKTSASLAPADKLSTTREPHPEQIYHWKKLENMFFY